MHYISTNIYNLMKERNLSLSEMARQTGVSKATLSKWFDSERKPRIDKVEKIANTYNLTLDRLLIDNDMNHIIAESFQKIGDQMFEVAAGQGRINDGYCTCDMHEADGSEYSRIIICGDSMFPSLHDGDIVKVHHVADDIRPSDFAVVKINGDEATVKHVEFVSDGIWLKAENKDVFPDKFYSMQECVTLPVQVIGKAVEIVSRKL